MKKKVIMTALLGLSLATMCLYWFGGLKGVEAMSGLLMLDNPIALTCIILAFIGIWTHYDHSQILGNIGLIGIIVMELYEFMTWHILPVTGTFDLGLSLSLAYPSFWFAFFSIVVTYVFYQFTNKYDKLT